MKITRSYYTRMNEILNGIMFSNMAGGALFCAVSVQQIQAVKYTSSRNLLFLRNSRCECVFCTFMRLKLFAFANTPATFLLKNIFVQ